MKSDGTYPAGYSKVSVKIEPKAIHDETNESVFDEFGRMSANLGTEVVPAIPGMANIVLDPFVFPTTEIYRHDAVCRSADVKVTPIASGDDGTQIWKITHNGVDTHPIHFHAFDVQVLNRVTWDNVIMRAGSERARLEGDDPGRAARGHLRRHPADRAQAAVGGAQQHPADRPHEGRRRRDHCSRRWPSQQGLPLAAFAPNGEPIDVYNHSINFGAEYVYHCHILSHEEMDMMRPVSWRIRRGSGRARRDGQHRRARGP